MAPRNKENNGQNKKQKDSDLEGSGDDYRKRRDRNNLAVKRSRVKSRLRTQETLERVHQLKSENDQLEEKIRLLSKELSFLKDLFLAHAGSGNTLNLHDMDLEQILSDTNTTAIMNMDTKVQTISSNSLLKL